MEKLLIIVIVIVALLIALRIFTLPIKLIFRLLINAVVGFICLFFINLAGSFIGLSLGINVLNAVVIGTLGIPGLILLLMLKWIFML